MKEIYVEWVGPYKYDEIIHNTVINGYSVSANDYGLYQIYGAHPLYGSKVLIYIGKTTEKFHSRLKGRGVIVDNIDSANVEIYLGRIYYDDTNQHNDIESDILRAESLLIHYHKPAHNSSSINSFKYYDETYRVYNIGSFRDLNSEISTNGFIKESKIYSKIDEIATKLNKDDKYNEEDGYGYWLDAKHTLWFGVDYELWNNDITIVLTSTKQLNQFKKGSEDLFYLPLYGDSDKIISQIKQYL